MDNPKLSIGVFVGFRAFQDINMSRTSVYLEKLVKVALSYSWLVYLHNRS